MNIDEVINGWTFEETIKTAESLMEVEKNMFKWDVIRHLRDFAEAYREQLEEHQQLEEQGLLLRLPCKVGDTIYVNGILGVGEAEEYKVIRVDYHSNLATKRSEFYIEALLVSDPRNSIGFYDKEIGKTVFLTKEEAEQKLKEMESDNNGTME